MFRKAVTTLSLVAGCAACQARSTSSAGIGAVSLGISEALIELLVVIGLAWSIWGTVRWNGAPRIAAVLPLVGAALLALNAVLLGPLPPDYLLRAVVVVPYMIVVAIWRRLARARR